MHMHACADKSQHEHTLGQWCKHEDSMHMHAEPSYSSAINVKRQNPCSLCAWSPCTCNTMQGCYRSENMIQKCAQQCISTYNKCMT